MLELQDVRVKASDFGLEASWTLPEGRIAALLGPSGAGKSTLLNAIAGFVPLARGRILWRVADISGLPPSKRPVAMLFQDNNLFPHLTAFQNLALAVTGSARARGDDAARIEEALAQVGLGGLGNRRPAALSGGQQGRVALARALLQDRPLLLLDEPFAALGPALKREMLELVATLAGARGATVLLVSHDPEDARAIADCVIVVAEGRAAGPRPTAEVLEAPPPGLAAYLGTGHR